MYKSGLSSKTLSYALTNSAFFCLVLFRASSVAASKVVSCSRAAGSGLQSMAAISIQLQPFDVFRIKSIACFFRLV